MNTLHDLMVNTGIKPGMAVVSIAGHDSGRVYLVISVDGSFVRLSDGELRSIVKQKRKRSRHVKKLGQAAGDLQMERLFSEKTPAQQDMIIKKLLSGFLKIKMKEV
jgi:ribosomal protein L14E/L6E/L27E